jgi:hypothetical protein
MAHAYFIAVSYKAEPVAVSHQTIANVGVCWNGVCEWVRQWKGWKNEPQKLKLQRVDIASLDVF